MRIHFDELEFDPTSPDFTTTATLNGQPFTGVAYFTDENFDTYYEWIYKNGNAHGRWFGVNNISKKLTYEQYYVDGRMHGNFSSWHDNGEMESVEEFEYDKCLFRLKWNRNGVLIRRYEPTFGIDIEYYDTGEVYKKTTGSSPKDIFTSTFQVDGTFLMEESLHFKHHRFDQEYLFNRSDELNATFHRDVVRQFIIHLLKESHQRTVAYLISLLNHSEPDFQAEAIIRLGQLKAREALPLLEKFSNNINLPHRETRFFGKEITNIYSFATLAERSRNQIGGNN